MADEEIWRGKVYDSMWQQNMQSEKKQEKDRGKDLLMTTYLRETVND